MEFRFRIRWTVYMLKWTCSVKLGTVGTVNDGMHGKTASLTVLTVCIKRKTVIFNLLSKYSHLLSLFCFSCFLTAHKWMRYVKFFFFHFFLSKTWRITILGWFFSVWFFDWVDCFFFPKSLRGLTFLPVWISEKQIRFIFKNVVLKT